MKYSIDDAFNYEEEFETEIQFLMKKYNLKRQDIRILGVHTLLIALYGAGTWKLIRQNPKK